MSGSDILRMTSFRMPMLPTLTCHFPAAAAPMYSRSTGKTNFGMALPEGPVLHIAVTRSVAFPPGSDFSFVSSSIPITAGRIGKIAGGFHSSALIVRIACSRVGTRFSFAWIFSLPAKTMLASSVRTSLAYLVTPKPAASLACASALPSTALCTTAATSVSRSKGPSSGARASFFLASFFESFAASALACAVAFLSFLPLRPPATRDASSCWSAASRLFSRSRSSCFLTKSRAAR
mmetsp:Transcript_133309/g.242876  ORF Transcript_133309/g.242876 Transcript_133309/m.242876 type:complete len:235 (+) Transcript_133309:3750-4454(+)